MTTEITHKEHFHGSDLEKIERIYHIPKEQIISFSSNVNPLGISPELKKDLIQRIDAIAAYPDRDYTSLRTHIGQYLNVNKDFILPGNGATELISIVFQVIQPKKSLILGPTYSEYEREVQLGGGKASYFSLKEEDNFLLQISTLKEQLAQNYQLLVICNPNNPTSTALTAGQMTEILTVCQEKNIYVLVDETYVEFVEDVKNITSVHLCEQFPNLIVLRGTSKFFATPGLRLGYAVTSNQQILDTIRFQVNPWSINSLAAIAGETMFFDNPYIEKTRRLIAAERKRMTEAVRKLPGLTVFEPMANFLLVKINAPDWNADMLFEKAIRQGMMIRNCASFPYLNNQFFRFCFLLPEDNNRLLSCIRTLAEKSAKKHDAPSPNC